MLWMRRGEWRVSLELPAPRGARRNDMSFTKISNGITRFIKDQEGASAIEYVVIVAMVALVVIGLMPNVGTQITTIFGRITTALTGIGS
jgi:pilus assembly protein Flp/PilA